MMCIPIYTTITKHNSNPSHALVLGWSHCAPAIDSGKRTQQVPGKIPQESLTLTLTCALVLFMK